MTQDIVEHRLNEISDDVKDIKTMLLNVADGLLVRIVKLEQNTRIVRLEQNERIRTWLLGFLIPAVLALIAERLLK